MASVEYDDAVVGAGILGLAVAYHLARRGRRVIVFERNARAQGASVRNFGMLWPIGQTAGRMYAMAMRSRAHWRNVLQASGLWHEETGSLHLAYKADEAQILREFTQTSEANGFDCQLMEPQKVWARCDAVNPYGLQAGMWSPTEICVDPREIIAGLPAFLHQQHGVTFQFNTAVTHYEQPVVIAGGEKWTANRLWVCSGDDLQTLYPGALQSLGLIRCKLQMMRSQSYGNTFHIGPMLAAGLTLRHYKSFENCPTLPALKQRVAEETPYFDCYGIHVLVSQNGAGEVILGDSHLYGDAIEPFDNPHIDALVLEYLNTFLRIPALQIASRWHGIYVKHPAEPYNVVHPAPNVTAITGVGGAGMTLSFGLTDEVTTEVLA